MNGILVSIIVPVYNVEKYLEKCVSSIINQSYKNIEIILVDDGSKDNSGLMCDEFAKKDDRIKVIHKTNGGLSSSRKSGLEQANGKYILFVDSDEWIDEETVEYLIEIAINKNSDCVCFSYVREYEEKSLIVSQNISKDIHRRLFGLINEELKNPQRMDSIASCCMKLYSKQCALKGKFFNAGDYANAEDTLFNIHALVNAQNCVYEDKSFYHYRKYNSNSLTNLYRKKLGEKLNKVFVELSNFINENNLNEDYKIALQNRIIFSIIGFILNEIGNPCYSDAILNIQQYLSSKTYIDAINNCNLKYVSILWRIIIYLCKREMSYSLYWIFYCIKILKKYR